MEKLSIYSFLIFILSINLVGCASSNKREAGFYGRVAPAKYSSPLPVEIAKDIEAITEDGALVMNPDPLMAKGLTAMSSKIKDLENRVSLSQRVEVLERRVLSSIESLKLNGGLAVGSNHHHHDDHVAKVNHVHTKEQKAKRTVKKYTKKAFLTKGKGPLMRGKSQRKLAGLSAGNPTAVNSKHGTSRVVSEDPKKGKTIVYTVKWGDTLMKIAFEQYANYIRWKEIYQINKDKMKSPRKMQVGTELTIENVKYVFIKKDGKPYLIRKEDTLKSISKKLYGTEDRWKEIWKNNPQLINNPKKIYAGFTLYAPSADKLELLRVPAATDKKATK